MCMSKVKEYYTKTLYTTYGLLLHYGEVFTAAMERSIREVENAEEMRRRGSVLNVNKPSSRNTGRFTELFEL